VGVVDVVLPDVVARRPDARTLQVAAGDLGAVQDAAADDADDIPGCLDERVEQPHPQHAAGRRPHAGGDAPESGWEMTQSSDSSSVASVMPCRTKEKPATSEPVPTTVQLDIRGRMNVLPMPS